MKDIDGTDAILLKNFFFPYYDISSMEGAFLKWFGFRKKILSGREILSARDGEIVFKGPLHRHMDYRVRRVRNKKARIFFVDTKRGTPAPYHFFVDFSRGLNLYQTVDVKSDFRPGEAPDPHGLEAILSNEGRNRYLGIWFTGRRELEGFMRGLKALEINDEAVPGERILSEGDHILVDISDTTDSIRYYFLKISSRDRGLRQRIRLIALTKKRL